MRVAAKALRAGVVGLGLGVAASSLLAQTSVPDAPKPQTLPQLNTIAPVAPSIPNAPLPEAPAASAPGSTLPSAPTPAQAARNAADTQAANANGGSTATHRSDIVVFSNFVEIPFTVKDSKGQLVPGLTPRDVQVYENGLRQQIRLFTVDPIPLSVAIVIDQSVTFDTMKKINASLTALQGAFTPYDEVAIYTYNNGVKEQTAFSGAQSTRVTFALERSKSEGRDPMMYMGGPLADTTVKNDRPVDPNTNRNNPAGVLIQNVPREYHTLNDAILTAGVEVSKAGRGRRRVIYVISDGREYGSQAKEKEVIRYLQGHEISVYGTLVGDSALPGMGFLDKIHLPLTMRDDVLPRYADATGGQCDPEFRPRGIQDSFAKLAEQVRSQYTVGYYTHEPLIDGKYRSVDVRVLRPSLDVIAKRGYYPTAQSAVPNRPVAQTGAQPAAQPDTSTTAPAPAAGSTP